MQSLQSLRFPATHAPNSKSNSGTGSSLIIRSILIGLLRQNVRSLRRFTLAMRHAVREITAATTSALGCMGFIMIFMGGSTHLAAMTR